MEPYYDLGPGAAAAGDPTTASGADMLDLGDHESITYSPNIRTAYQTSANTNDVPLPESLRTIPANPQFSIELYDKSIDNLLALMREHAEKVTTGVDPDIQTALVLRPQVKKLLTFTFAFIPETEKSMGADAPHGLWIPSAYLQNVGELFSYGRLSENENNSPFTAQIGVSRTPSGMGTDALSIYGPPAAEGLTWSLPFGA